MKVVWKYNPDNPFNNSNKEKLYVKHAFFKQESVSAVCGRGIVWSSNAKWASDVKGLNERATCKGCLKLLEKK